MYIKNIEHCKGIKLILKKYFRGNRNSRERNRGRPLVYRLIKVQWSRLGLPLLNNDYAIKTCTENSATKIYDASQSRSAAHDLLRVLGQRLRTGEDDNSTYVCLFVTVSLFLVSMVFCTHKRENRSLYRDTILIYFYFLLLLFLRPPVSSFTSVFCEAVRSFFPFSYISKMQNTVHVALGLVNKY